MFKEVVASLIASKQAEITALDDKRQALRGELANLESIVPEVEALVESEKVKAHDEGYDAGVKKSNETAGLPEDAKQFSLDELNAEIKPRDEKIAEQSATIERLSTSGKELEERVAALETKASEDIATAKKAAVDEFKADLKAKYEAQQVAETEGETGFAALLS